MTIFYRLFLFCSLFWAQDLYSQNKYSFKWYSADSNHLPQNSVKSIAPDKYGYIWLATESGLVRYDGQNFKIYSSENVPGLKADRFYNFGGSVASDSLVIRNDIDQLVCISHRNVKVENKAVRDLPITIKSPFRTKFAESITASYKVKEYDYFKIYDDNSSYIIGNDTIRKYDKKNRLLLTFRYDYPVDAEFFMQSGDLYLMGKNNDYIKFQGSYPKHFNWDHFFEGTFRVYTNMAAQETFFYLDNKLYLVKEVFGKLKIKCILENFNLPQHNIISLYYDDKNNILYLGSANKGLLVINKQLFRHNTSAFYHDAGTNGVYYSLIKHSKDEILTSTGEILNAYGNAGKINIGQYSDKYMLFEGEDGDLWTKNDDVVYRLKGNLGNEIKKSWTFDGPVRGLTQIKDKIWLSIVFERTNKGEIYTIDSKTNNLSLFLKLDFLPTCLYSDGVDDNILWVGSRFGLYTVDLKSKSVKKVKGLKDANIRSIYFRDKDELWITSYNKGIMLYKGGKLTVFPVDRNGYLLTSHCIVEDKQGFFWITTNRGLFQAKKEDLYNYAEGKNRQVYYYYYDKNDGFANNEFNGGCQPCGIYLDDKTIFFPSIEGVVNFNPEEVYPLEPKKGIYIDEIIVDSISYSSINGLVFKRNFDRITFYISSPYFGNQYNQNIEVKLEGEINQGWVNIKDGNISFSTLPPGEYTLTARKLNGFNSEFITAKLSFCVKPAFWQTKWFLILLIVVLILFLATVTKFRITYVKYKNKVLERKVAVQTSQLRNTIIALRKTQENLSRQNANHKKLIKTITHDIKSPLRFMAITGKYVYSNMEKENIDLKEEIESIYTSSIQLYHFVDEFLEYTKETDSNSKSELYYLFILVAEKIEFFGNIAASKKIELFNNIPMDVTVTINKHLLSIIIHNLLDNAIKNTYTGTIHFASSIEAGILKISIKDTGIGMSDEQVTYYNNLAKNKDIDGHTATAGMGLHAIIELLSILNGDMEIISSGHIGTQFILSFKI